MRVIEEGESTTAIKLAVPAKTADIIIICDGDVSRDVEPVSEALAVLYRAPLATRLEIPARTAVALSRTDAWTTRELEADRTAVAASSSAACAASDPEAERTAVACQTTADANGKPWLTSALERYHVLFGCRFSSHWTGSIPAETASLSISEAVAARTEEATNLCDGVA
jgi:hypothetical protein